MIQRKTRWSVTAWSDSDERNAEQMSKELGLPLLLTRLLIQRGYTDNKLVEQFLRGGAEHLHDPYLLLGMEAAVERIRKAGINGEKLRIYGDYDADGVSSTSLLIQLFRELGFTFDYYIPHRALEGYGLNKEAILQASNDGIQLIVTVDTGISAYEEIEYAQSLGIDVVITDHHEPPERIPEAAAVINPKQKACTYPFKGLAGVGVAFKLATALLGRPPLEWADIVSLGTIADLMPLEDENRLLVRYGLERLRSEASVGFKALAEVGSIDLHSISSTNIAFGMAPRVNAAGRLDHARRAVELLTTDDYDSAILLAIGLDSLNKERQRIVESIVKEAEQQWLDRCATLKAADKEAPAVIVLAGEGWNVGVIGIVASKILERYYKPVLILGVDAETGLCKGSARSIEGYDLHAALTACDDLLLHYGGHQAAAGMTLHKDHLQQLEDRLSQLALEWLTSDEWLPKLAIDFVCKLEEASIDTISQLSLLEPFGMGNPSPRLLFQKVELAEKRAIGKESKHLKLALGKGRLLLDAIGFHMGEKAGYLHQGMAVDVVGELSVNEWNGQSKPQLQLHDLHVEQLSLSVFPEREQFGQVYQRIRQLGTAPLEGIAARLAKECSLTSDMVQLMLDVFEELQFIYRDGGLLTAIASPQKRDLASSKRYQQALKQIENDIA